MQLSRAASTVNSHWWPQVRQRMQSEMLIAAITTAYHSTSVMYKAHIMQISFFKSTMWPFVYVADALVDMHGHAASADICRIQHLIPFLNSCRRCILHSSKWAAVGRMHHKVAMVDDVLVHTVDSCSSCVVLECKQLRLCHILCH